MNSTIKKASRGELQARAKFLAEMDELSLRRVRMMINGKPVMVTLIDRPDEYPQPGDELPAWGHQPDEGGEA